MINNEPLLRSSRRDLRAMGEPMRGDVAEDATRWLVGLAARVYIGVELRPELERLEAEPVLAGVVVAA